MEKHSDEGPWGAATTATNPASDGFEDSFSPEPVAVTIGGEYIPLDDSSQYLASLERKLARLQGRTAARRHNESQRLIDALASSRDTQAHSLVTANDDICNDDPEIFSADSEHSAAHPTTTVDPQGALGAMLRRVVPDKVALTHEELCRLLEADILAKIHEAMEDDEQVHDRLQSVSVNPKCDDASAKRSSVNSKTEGEDEHTRGCKDDLKCDVIVTSQPEHKEQSSDEGEK